MCVYVHEDLCGMVCEWVRMDANVCVCACMCCVYVCVSMPMYVDVCGCVWMCVDVCGCVCVYECAFVRIVTGKKGIFTAHMSKHSHICKLR